MRRTYREALDLQLDMARYWTIEEGKQTARDLLRAWRGLEKWDTRPFEHLAPVRLSTDIARAERYFIEDSIRNLLVMASTKVPPEATIPQSLPAEHGVVIFQTPLYIPKNVWGAGGYEEDHTVTAISWHPGPIFKGPTVLIHTYSEDWGYYPIVPITSEVWPHASNVGKITESAAHNIIYSGGQKLEDFPRPDTYIPWSNNLLLAFWMFIDSKILVTREEASPRPAVKRAERASTPTPTTDVRIVHLRKTLSTRPDTGDDTTDEKKHVDWQHQWLVSFHYRTYTKGRERPITIPIWPYRKGPADKPFMPVRETVFVVDR